MLIVESTLLTWSALFDLFFAFEYFYKTKEVCSISSFCIPLSAMGDDLSYGLNTLGPLCLWQCFSYECSPKPRVLLLLDDRKGVGLGSGGAGGWINDDVRSPFGPISWRKSSQQFPLHACCRWPCENLFCSFRKAHGGMPGSIRYHQQPSKTHRKHPPLAFCSCQMLNIGQVSLGKTGHY